MSNTTRSAILEAGAKLASKHGAVNVTRKMVADAAGVSMALVSHYFGSAKEAQPKYARKAKALGLKTPTPEQAKAIGTKLRAHKRGDERDTRKRSAKEVKAIKDKKLPAPAERKPAAPRERKPAAPATSPLPAPAERKGTAARMPMPPPSAPVEDASLPMPPAPQGSFP